MMCVTVESDRLWVARSIKFVRHLQGCDWFGVGFFVLDDEGGALSLFCSFLLMKTPFVLTYLTTVQVWPYQASY